MPYYDEEGNEVEGVMTPEEVEALKAELTEKLTTKEQEIEEKEKELASLKTKDFNFRKFEEATEKQKEEMMKEFTDKEQALIQEVSSMKSQFLSEQRASVLDIYVGSDEELRKKVEEKANSLYGKPAETKEEYTLRVKEALTLVRSGAQVNPIHAPSVSGAYGKTDRPKYTDTPEGEKNYKTWFR